MEFYKEYPIRCKTCNEQIACFSKLYEDLISSMTSEEALNQLGIMNYCSRIAMMNPTIVIFNLENRKAVEGIEMLDIELPSVNQSFISCIDSKVLSKPEKTETSKTEPVKAKLPETAISIPIITPAKKIIPKIVSGIEIETKNIELLTPITTQEFDKPTTVGIPVINPSQNDIETEIPVGVGKKVKVLSGRTYLAR